MRRLHGLRNDTVRKSSRFPPLTIVIVVDDSDGSRDFGCGPLWTNERKRRQSVRNISWPTKSKVRAQFVAFIVIAYAVGSFVGDQRILG